MWRAQERTRSTRSRKNGAQSATIKSRALGALKLASDENVPAKRADFLIYFCIYEQSITRLFKNNKNKLRQTI